MGNFEREQARLLSLWEELQCDNEDEISSEEGEEDNYWLMHSINLKCFEAISDIVWLLISFLNQHEPLGLPDPTRLILSVRATRLPEG
jgi:hypothetical protein